MASTFPPRKDSRAWRSSKHHIDTMISKLEDTLLRCRDAEGSVRTTLFAYLLDDGRVLRSLRGVSRVLHDLVDHQAQRVFNTIYLHHPPRDRSLDTLQDVAPFCDHLVIKVGYPNDTLEQQVAVLRLRDGGSPGSHGRSSRSLSLPGPETWQKRRSGERRISSKEESLFTKTIERLSGGGERRRSNDSDSKRSSGPSSPTSPCDMFNRELRDKWLQLLAHFPQITQITLSANGDPACPGTSETEKFLANLRTAIERAALPNLHTLPLAPMHAYGIMHIRWDAFGAYIATPPYGTAVWHNLATLELQLHNPFATGKLTEHQHVACKQQLHQYLRSFAPTLRYLRFMWLGGAQGPNPLLLDHEHGMEHVRIISWRCLLEVWLGNCAGAWGIVQARAERCQGLRKLMVSRNAGSSQTGGFEEEGSWVEVLLGQGRSTVVASSVYSRSVGGNTECGISRTSREVPIMLDL